MNKDKHQAAIDALSELMRSELDGDMRGRFACLNRLAVLAQKLQHALRGNHAEFAARDRRRRGQLA